MNGYANFSFYYDMFTQNVDYSGWAAYILKLLELHRHPPGLTLDLACGTGNLLFELLKRGVDVFGVDASAEMLAQAKDKSYDMGQDVLLLCQNMQNLDLYGTVDTVVCALDSLNHLRDEVQLKKTFAQIFLFLNPGGMLVFDVNTIYKHEIILGDNPYIYETGDVLCAWRNAYHPQSHTVDIRLDFFEKNASKYERTSEAFSERAYPLEAVADMLAQTGFTDIHQYDELKFSPPRAESQRVFFTARKD